MPHIVVRVARQASIAALFIVAAMLGILSGVLFAYAGDLPQVSALDDYTPSTITRVYAANGQVVGEFATQRRIVVSYDDVNPVLRHAIIATEDAEFERHFGINVWRIFAAAVTDIAERRAAQGASPPTQQIARNLQAQADAAKQRPIVTRGQPTQPPGIAPFFVEEVRKHLEREFGAKALYENGLAVTTTLDVRLQEIANRSVERGLRQLDKRHGYRRAKRNVAADGQTIEGFRDDRWARPLAVGDVVPAVVVSVSKPAARLRIGRYHADLTREGYAWTRRASATELFKAGDVIEVSIAKLDEASGAAAVSLEQTPVVEGALVAIDNHTGQIKAMVGGWNFNRSKFNRAVQ